MLNICVLLNIIYGKCLVISYELLRQKIPIPLVMEKVNEKAWFRSRENLDVFFLHFRHGF